jgi:phosphatidylglycerol:prolipoprotein diacylglycerol transferase
MHPILVQIPLGPITIAVVAVLFGLGGLVRARFKPADKDSSYFAHFLGLNVQWGEVEAPWGKAVQAGLVQAVIAGAATFGVKLVAQRIPPGYDAIPLHTYGVMMAIAFVVGIWLAMRAARAQGLPPVPLRDEKGRPIVEKGVAAVIPAESFVADLTFYLLVAGLVGSRVLYIMTRWDAEYARDPSKVFRIWEGGLVWYGAFIGSAATAVYYVRKYKVAFLPIADVLIPSVSIGHALGRLGCFAAGCCFGNVARPGFPLAVHFPHDSPAFADHLSSGLVSRFAEQSLAVYPTQIMESTGETLIFLILLLVRSRKKFHGQVLLTYIWLYPVLRTIMEMFRGDKIRGFFFKWPSADAPMLLSTSQGVSIVVAIAAIALTVVLGRQRGAQAQAEQKAA